VSKRSRGFVARSLPQEEDTVGLSQSKRDLERFRKGESCTQWCCIISDVATTTIASSSVIISDIEQLAAAAPPLDDSTTLNPSLEDLGSSQFDLDWNFDISR
jgi:hypothetical protein